MYPIAPVACPRMTNRDRWKKRPVVQAYFAFRDEVKARRVSMPIPSKIIFWMPMPKALSRKKKLEMDNAPHSVRRVIHLQFLLSRPSLRHRHPEGDLGRDRHRDAACLHFVSKGEIRLDHWTLLPTITVRHAWARYWRYRIHDHRLLLGFARSPVQP